MDIQEAKARLKVFSRSGSVHLQGPTPERAAKAGADIRIERTSRAISLVLHGKPVVEKLTTARMRVTEGAFDRAAGRGQLHPDPERNRILAAAGRKYRSQWTQAGLEPIQGQDPGKIRSTSPSAGLLGTEAKCEAFKEYCAASDALGRRDRVVIDAVVLRDRPLVEIGRQIAMQNDAKLCTGIAMHKLRSGLTDLAVHFGMLASEDDTAPMRALTPAELPL